MTVTDNTQPDNTINLDRETASVLRILFTVLVVLAGWGTSIALWGIPGLYLPALAAVPVIWVVLILMARG
jgi:Mn2+/Fe2+ NRAMP family transporter